MSSLSIVPFQCNIYCFQCYFSCLELLQTTKHQILCFPTFSPDTGYATPNQWILLYGYQLKLKKQPHPLLIMLYHNVSTKVLLILEMSHLTSFRQPVLSSNSQLIWMSFP